MDKIKNEVLYRIREKRGLCLRMLGWKEFRCEGTHTTRAIDMEIFEIEVRNK